MYKKLLILMAVLLVFVLIFLVYCFFFQKETVELPASPSRNTDVPMESPSVPYFPVAKRQPISRLLLINFEKDPDAVYTAFELMYLDSKQTGSGYRVIAYRHDGYSDYYDEKSLRFDPAGNQSVTGQGVKHHLQVDLGQPHLSMLDQGIQARFSFEDYLGRPIEFSLNDESGLSSKKTDLLAPVGASSRQPTAFPLIYLYDFDFVPKKESQAQLLIDQQEHRPDDFPVPFPINGKTRTFMRYSFDVDAIDLFPDDAEIKEVALDENLSYQDQLATYYYSYEDQQMKLAEIVLEIEKPISIRFSPAISSQTDQGAIAVLAQEDMGPLLGHYQVKASNQEVTLGIQFDQGWLAESSGLMASIVLSSKQSVFRNWPKAYNYQASWDLSTNQFKSRWLNSKH